MIDDALRLSLLNALQRGVPLTPRPYERMAVELDCPESAVRDAIAIFRSEGLLREISGLFDVAALGYRQALVAMRVRPERLEKAGLLASCHPGVSHCYARSGTFNLWLTLAVSPSSSLGLENTAGKLARLCEADAHLLLPTIRRYKLDVHFSPSGANAATPQAGAPTPSQSAMGSAPKLGAQDIRAVQALQEDLPNESEPFDVVAARFGLAREPLLRLGGEFLARGWLRRYAGVLRHRAAGATSNVLVAWSVGDSAADAAGAICARMSPVSHCYLRPSAADWPYNLYTMIHGRNDQDCAMTIDQIAAETGLSRHADLWTQKEFRKSRVKLFSDQEKLWEETIS
jgi:DNA-binding Lrp family transcriptional regulator